MKSIKDILNEATTTHVPNAKKGVIYKVTSNGKPEPLKAKNKKDLESYLGYALSDADWRVLSKSGHLRVAPTIELLMNEDNMNEGKASKFSVDEYLRWYDDSINKNVVVVVTKVLGNGSYIVSYNGKDVKVSENDIDDDFGMVDNKQRYKAFSVALAKRKGYSKVMKESVESFIKFLKESKKTTRADLVKVFGIVGGFNDMSRVEKEYGDEIDAALIALGKNDMKTFYAIVGAESSNDKKKISKLIGESFDVSLDEAYMTQDEKKELVSRVKPVMAKYKVKASYAIRNHSTFVVNIKSAPFDILNEYLDGLIIRTDQKRTYITISDYNIAGKAKGKTHKFLLELFKEIRKNNHDNSDMMTDYFDVGFYVSINVGDYNKPFVVK